MISSGDTEPQENYQKPPEILGALLLLSTTAVVLRSSASYRGEVLRGDVVITSLGVPSDGTGLKTEVYTVGTPARIRNVTVLIDTRVLRHRGHRSR